MKSVLLAAAVSLASLAAFASPPNIDKVNGSVRAEAGKEYGSLETVNGSIRVEAGAIARSAETVNGSVSLAEGARIGSIETVNGAVSLAAQAEVEKGIEVVNGGISLGEGALVRGRIEGVNGSISLRAAEVQGGIETVNGNITIGADSRVAGGILVNKPTGSWFNWGSESKKLPRIEIGPRAVVEGDLVFKREVELFVHETAKVGRIEGATAQRFGGDSVER
jgi:DUF4097 and DUF4098 domain-containing protein YvlB